MSPSSTQATIITAAKNAGRMTIFSRSLASKPCSMLAASTTRLPVMWAAIR